MQCVQNLVIFFSCYCFKAICFLFQLDSGPSICQPNKVQFKPTLSLETYIYVFSFIFSRYKNDDKIAFYYTTERKETVGIGQMTFGELKKNVGLYASALRKFGIKKAQYMY